MKYIERDFAGKLIGVYPNPQPGDLEGTFRTEPEPVPDDHPEIVEFLKGRPVLTQAHMTKEDFEREDREQKQSDEDGKKLQQLYLSHLQVWAELETALSALLYTILNIQPQTSQLAYAIYYGLTGFDARKETVSHCMIQLIDERKKDLEQLRESWDAIHKKLDAARNKRNAVAHSVIQTVIYNETPKKRVKRALLSPLPFDVVRMWREIDKSGRPKAMDVNEFSMTLRRHAALTNCIDAMNKVIGQYHQFGAATLPKTTDLLTVRLKALSSA